MKTLLTVIIFLFFIKSVNSQWLPQNSGTSQRLLTVFFLNENYGWAGGNEGCIIKTTDGGLNWTYYSLGTKFTVHSIYFVDSLKGWAAIYTFNPQTAGYIIATTDGGSNWYYQHYTNNISLHRIQFIDENLGWAVGSNGIFLRTLNGGAAWQEYFISDQWTWAVYFINQNFGWCGDGTSGYIKKSTDGGLTWQFYYAQSNARIFDIHFINNSTGWAAGEYGQILRTDNGGLTWQPQSSSTSQQLRDIDFIDENNGWAVGLNGAIVHTTNGGTNWFAQSPGISNNLFGLSMFNNTIGWVAGDQGIVLFTDNGGGGITPVELTSFVADYFDGAVNLSWATATELNNSGFNVERKTEDGEWNKITFIQGNGTTTETKYYSYSDILNDNLSTKLLYRLKQVDFDGSVHYSNEIAIDISIPTKFTLKQNYPNPFNPITIINYQLSSKSSVTLKVFDILGNEVETLVQEEKDAGYYQVSFDASSLSSGIYFYMLKADNFVQTRKMILLK